MTATRLSRREFLERMGILGGLGVASYGLGALGVVPLVQAYGGPPRLNHRIGAGRHVVILGAGIAGLCTAYLLRHTRFKITIIEPNPYVGGRCLTLRRGDIVAEENTDRLGQPFRPLRCDFDKQPDIYLNAGASRIPQSHTAILHYCKKLKIKLQPFIFACRANLLQSDRFNQGQPVPVRWIKHDLRGHIAEILAHAIRTDQINQFVAPANQEAFLRMVRYFGHLAQSDQTLRYIGTRRGGYAQKPGAGMAKGALRSPIELNELLETGIWQTGLFNDMYLYWQTSLMQAQGGMDHIPRAFQNSLGQNTRLWLRAKADVLSQTSDKVIIKHSNSDLPIEADYCVATMAPSLLNEIMDPSFPPSLQKALADIFMVPACKVGWQAKYRFWEEENEIYGGISWTDHMIRQIWYPSHGYHAPKGVLTGAYNFGEDARTFGLMPHQERMAVALAGGEKLHPGQFARYVEKAISIAWHNMPHQAGGWAYYKDQAENPAYLTINRHHGRLLLAGDYFSFLSGWMEGAVRSAELAVNRIARMAAG